MHLVSSVSDWNTWYWQGLKRKRFRSTFQTPDCGTSSSRAASIEFSGFWEPHVSLPPLFYRLQLVCFFARVTQQESFVLLIHRFSNGWILIKSRAESPLYCCCWLYFLKPEDPMRYFCTGEIDHFCWHCSSASGCDRHNYYLFKTNSKVMATSLCRHLATHSTYRNDISIRGR